MNEQGSKEWLNDRRGKATASKFNVLMAVRGLGKTAKDYALEIAADSIIVTPDEINQSQAMKDGAELEPYAAKRYEMEELTKVYEVGFLNHPSNQLIGGSPDRLVGEDGGLEIKCPKQTKHISNLMATECPTEYYDQIQGLMYITGRKWWDFVSFNPTFVQEKQYICIEVFPNPKWVETFEARLVEFEKLVNEYKLKLNK
tara:strand:- start:3221 stop:3820 length:600 start_codon:yes stop_codon:yes gene_type:complete